MRVRIRFSKLGKIRWTSHRDVARMWERAFRRVQLPLAYSEGFSPRPKVSFGLALPTGYESVAEYLDVELRDSVELSTLAGRLSDALPVGVDATAVADLAPRAPSLQEEVTSCSWRWLASGPDLGERIDALIASPSTVVTRTRKGVEVTEDIRESIISLQLIGPAEPDDCWPQGGWWLEGELATQPRSIRPTEVMIALNSGVEERLVRRTHQWILRDGARREPLAIGSLDRAPDAPHAWGRAS
jgi:radical SAM-linked protein